MYDRILVPLDGSPLAEKVLPYVTKISKGLGIPVRLIQAFATPSEEMGDPQHGRYMTGISAGVHDESIDYLDSVKRKIETPGVEITSEAHEGNAVSQIIDIAGKSPDSLVAMSTHGRSGVSRWVMGSVTDKVLHSIKNPMLIVRGGNEGEPDTNLETIIVPVDGSSLAEEVIPHVAALAKGLGLKVTLLRVAATAAEFSAHTGYQRLEGEAGIHFPGFEEMAKEAGDQALTYLQKLEETLRGQGVDSVEHQIVHGAAANVIVDVAQETPDNLVAMTTHGRSGPARWAMGSVADKVVRHSGDPVLVVRVA